jgi:hypothetical protein
MEVATLEVVGEITGAEAVTMSPDSARGDPYGVLGRWWRSLRLAWLSGLLLAPLTASAQGPANQGLVVRDDSLGIGKGQVVAPGIDPNGDAADYLITPDLGRQIGDTLLQSFWDFGLAPGEIATFTGGGSIEHIATPPPPTIYAGATSASKHGRTASFLPSASRSPRPSASSTLNPALSDSRMPLSDSTWKARPSP